MEHLQTHRDPTPQIEMSREVGDGDVGGGRGATRRGVRAEANKPAARAQRHSKANASPFNAGGGGRELRPSDTHPGHARSSPTREQSALPSTFNGKRKVVDQQDFYGGGPSTRAGPSHRTRQSAPAGHDYVELSDDDDRNDNDKSPAAPVATLNGSAITDFYKPVTAQDSTKATRGAVKGTNANPRQPLLKTAAESVGTQRKPRRPDRKLPSQDSDIVIVVDEPKPRRSARHSGNDTVDDYEAHASGSTAPPGTRSRPPHSRSTASASPTKQMPPPLPLDDRDDPIQQFTPTPPDPRPQPTVARDKGKGKAKEDDIAVLNETRDPQLQHSTLASRKMKRMQDKNGHVPAPPTATRSTKKNLGIPSSGLPKRGLLLANISSCYIQAHNDRPLRVEAGRMRLHDPHGKIIVELFKGKTDPSAARFDIRSIVKLFYCAEETSQFCRMTVNLSADELDLLKRTYLGLCQIDDFDLLIDVEFATGNEALRVVNALTDLVKKQVGNAVSSILPSTVLTFLNGHNINQQAPRRRDGPAPSHNAYLAARRRHDEVKRYTPTPTGSKPRSRGESTFTQPKLEFPSVATASAATTTTADNPPARRSTRLSTAPVKMSETDDINDIEEVPATTSRKSHPDKNDLLFPYPLEGRVDLHITKDALYRLQDGDFLNDVFIEFGLKHTLAEHPELRADVHLLNSFFYERLSKKDPRKQKASDDDWPGYNAVKKWTKTTDVFAKKFIILPINENFHWYFAIIYNPAGILKEDAAPGPSTTPVASADPPAPTKDIPRESPDPLDVVSEPEDEVQDDVTAVRGGVDKIQIKSPTPPQQQPSPQPIVSDLFSMFQQQLAGTPSVEPHEDSAALDEDQSKAKGTREDYDIVGTTDKTFIMIFDSLGGTHRAVATNLKRWLFFEARDKLGREADVDNAIYIEAKVPLQQNFSDCGVFLIHYVKVLLENQERVLNFIGKAPPKAKKEDWTNERNDVWNEKVTPDLRKEWINTVNTLTAQYNSLQDPNATLPPPESQTSVVLSSQQGEPRAEERSSPMAEPTIHVPNLDTPQDAPATGQRDEQPVEQPDEQPYERHYEKHYEKRDQGSYPSALSPSPTAASSEQPAAAERSRYLTPPEQHTSVAADQTLISELVSDDSDDDLDDPERIHDLNDATPDDASDAHHAPDVFEDPGDEVLQPMNLLAKVTSNTVPQPPPQPVSTKHPRVADDEQSANEAASDTMDIDEPHAARGEQPMQPNAAPSDSNNVNALAQPTYTLDDDDEPRPRPKPKQSFRVGGSERSSRIRASTPYAWASHSSPSGPSRHRDRIIISNTSTTSSHPMPGANATASSSALPYSPEVLPRGLMRHSESDDLESREGSSELEPSRSPRTPSSSRSTSRPGNAVGGELGQRPLPPRSTGAPSHASPDSEPTAPSPTPARVTEGKTLEHREVEDDEQQRPSKSQSQKRFYARKSSGGRPPGSRPPTTGPQGGGPPTNVVPTPSGKRRKIETQSAEAGSSRGGRGRGHRGQRSSARRARQSHGGTKDTPIEIHTSSEDEE